MSKSRRSSKFRPTIHAPGAALARHRQIPGPARSAWQRGARAYEQGNRDAAITAFQRAVALAPHFADAHSDLGVCFLQQGRYPEAQAAFEAAVKINPGHMLAQENLASLYRELGNHAGAVTMLEEIAARKPEDVVTHDNLARARRELEATRTVTFANSSPLPGMGGLPARPSITLALIARNEAHNLPRLFASLREAVDEIVVADTGSTDDTLAVAGQWGAKVVHFPWVNDFAAAKNAALDRATGEWILHLDADMELEAAHASLIRQAVASGRARAYFINIRSPRSNGRVETVAHPWLFENASSLRFTGAVHEQILPQMTAAGIPPARTGIVVHHYGYATDANTAARHQRDLQLLAERQAAGEDSAMLHFYLGRNHLALEQYAQAEREYRSCLDDPDITWRLRANAYHGLAESRLRQDDTEGALALAGEFTRLFPHDRVSWAAAGRLYGTASRFDDAARAFTRALALEGYAGAEGIVMEMGDEILEHELAQTCAGQENWPLAATHFRRAIEGGMNTPAVFGELARAELRAGNRSAAEQTLRSALALHPADSETNRQLGLLLLNSGRLPEAIAHLENAVSLAPSAPDLHNDLGAAHARAGDLPRAIKAFAAELALNPRSDRAHFNVGVLHFRLGDRAQAASCFEQALLLNPANADARRGLTDVRPAGAG